MTMAKSKHTVVFMEGFHHYDYDNMIQVYLILGGKEPIAVYMHESCGYYNCYSSLDTMLRRETGGDFEQDIVEAIPAELVDTEDGQPEFEKLLIKAFT